jgi:hypothetical protein
MDAARILSTDYLRSDTVPRPGGRGQEVITRPFRHCAGRCSRRAGQAGLRYPDGHNRDEPGLL